MAKLPKKNGFCIFMDERRAGVLAAGYKLSRGRHDLAEFVSEDWKALPEEEKAKYHDRAKRCNQQARRYKNVPVACQISAEPQTSQRTLAKMDHSDKTSQVDIQAMKDARAIVFKMFENETWKDHPIVICCFTQYFESEYIETCLPAELGLTAMTLKNGVIDNFARIIDPGLIPKGHEEDVKIGVEKLGIPKPGNFPEFADYNSLISSVYAFLNKYQGDYEGNGDNLQVFAFDSDYVAVRKCFDWLFSITGKSFPVKILSLDLYAYLASFPTPAKAVTGSEVLVVTARKKHESIMTDDSLVATVSSHRVVGKPLVETFVYPFELPMTAYGLFVNESDVDNAIKGVDNHKYSEELCCLYHGKSGNQVQNCALNISNRYAFSILEILTISNEIPIEAGRHFPQLDDTNAERFRRFTLLRQWGITNFELGMPATTFESRDNCYFKTQNHRADERSTHSEENRLASLTLKGGAKGTDDAQNTLSAHDPRNKSAKNEEKLYRYGVLEVSNDDTPTHPYTCDVPQIFLGKG